MHENALKAARAGVWTEAVRLLSPLMSGSSNPWVYNDLAVALHQSGRTAEALAVLRELKESPQWPALLRLNRTYLEKAHYLAGDFDPSWRHLDLDGVSCPERPPLVSVIVRTYRRPELLGEALASLARQSFTNFETIVVNDGGEPESEEVVRRSGLKNARYVRRPHQGRVQTLNDGLAMAHGKYVTGLDDDDVVEPHHLKLMVEYLEAPGAAEIVYADYRVVRYERSTTGGLKPAAAREVRAGEYRPGLLFQTNPCTILLMARRSCYERVGRFHPGLELAEDWEMWMRMAEHFSFHHLPAVTAEIRERPGDSNLTGRKLREKYLWDNIVLFMHRGLPLLSEPERPELLLGYQKALKLLDAFVSDQPEVLPFLNLRGLWTMKKPYAWWADHGRWFHQLGEPELSRRCYAFAARLDPFQPKLWAGWAAGCWR